MTPNKTISLWMAAAAALALSLTAPAFAESPALRGPVDPAKAEMMRERFVERAQTELGLDEATANRVVDAVKRHREQKRDTHQANRALVAQIRAELAKPSPNDATLSAAMAQITENRNGAQVKETEFSRELDGLLTPTQKAKLMIHMLDRAKRMHSGHSGPGRGRGEFRGRMRGEAKGGQPEISAPAAASASSSVDDLSLQDLPFMDLM